MSNNNQIQPSPPKNIRVEKNAYVTTIILQRPEVKNAVDGPMGPSRMRLSCRYIRPFFAGSGSVSDQLRIA